ncbi:hydroxyproline O-galactosyltransferase HPGT1-like isoform X2 [Durio zibethinus]|uniref:Hexosyltransferase n=1 Tax=Durio zibethinus TaxID=66656 RepID=A0A6P5YC33_DURZI|nr:hydroxyproline O-galactosyltransferase HPGT1-like isoform X2 [Durio zibethinus]
MQSKGSNSMVSNMIFRTRISSLLISMFATFASFYVAGRLWQDAENRVYLIKELDRITGLGQSAISVDDTLKIIACREQQKKLSALEMDLAAARQEGFTSKRSSDTDGAVSKRRPLVVIGVLTGFGRKNNRDAIRKAWMGSGATLKKMENEKGIVSRFVIGRSANRGDSLDRSIDDENRQTNDFIILDQLETPGELPKKAKRFFAFAADRWDAEFYAKVNDDIYMNIDALGATLTSHLDKPRVYIGCMKSGEVFSEPSHKWYEPDWWKFGDKKSSLLRTYAHDDVSAGSWFLGLDVKHVDEGKFCCTSWSTGAICSGV